MLCRTPCLQEKLVKKMTKKVRSKEQEQELSVQGIFMSIQDMKDEKVREERINSIRADCEAGPKGLIRWGLSNAVFMPSKMYRNFCDICIHVLACVYVCPYMHIYICITLYIHVCT